MLFLAKELKRLKGVFLFLSFPLFSGMLLTAQDAPPSAPDSGQPAPQILLTEVNSTLVDAPVGNGSTSPSYYASDDNPNYTGQWLKVEFTYTVTPTAKSLFVDAAQFKIWIEGRDLNDPQAKDERGTTVAFTSTLNYVNVAKARTAYGVVYLNPATLNRYCTSTGSADFTNRFEVYVEAYVGGKLNSAAHKNRSEPPPTWFAQVKVVPNLVYNHDQSPFALTDVNKYPPLALTPAAP